MMMDPKPINEATSVGTSSPYAKRTTMAGASDQDATRLYSAQTKIADFVQISASDALSKQPKSSYGNINLVTPWEIKNQHT